jgi:hypothetical protein
MHGDCGIRVRLRPSCTASLEPLRISVPVGIGAKLYSKSLSKAAIRFLCAIHPPEAIKKILDCLGIPSKPPPISPAVLESDTENYINS